MLNGQKALYVSEKYTAFVQWYLKKINNKMFFEKLSQIKAVFKGNKSCWLLSYGVDEGERIRLFDFQNQVPADWNNFIEVVILNHQTDLFYDMLVKFSIRLRNKAIVKWQFVC